MADSTLIRQFASSLKPAGKGPRRPIPPKVGEVALEPDFGEFVALCDGGYTPGNLYHFFGFAGPMPNDIEEWNRQDLWRSHFDLDPRHLVFAEDILGNQFCFYASERRRVIKMLSLIDGSLTPCADSFRDFLTELVLDDELNGENAGLLRAVEERVGCKYQFFQHLSARIPPALGGAADDADNLELMDSLANLKITGQILAQVKHLRPGTSIKDIDIDLTSMTVKLIT